MAIRVIDDSKLQDIAVAIQGKDDGGQMTVDEMPTRIAAIENLSPPLIEDKDVSFIDYDGTILYSYSLDEIQRLNELPPLPVKDDFIYQEWNWTLADIKAYNSEMYIMAIGYPKDGKTRIVFEFEDGDDLEVPIRFIAQGEKLQINWGDGNIEDLSIDPKALSYRYTTHQYASSGKYIVSIDYFGNYSYAFNAIGYNKEIIKKKNVKQINEGLHLSMHIVLIGFYNLEKYSMIYSEGLTTIGNYSFLECFSLKALGLPSNIEKFNNFAVLGNNRSLEYISYNKSFLGYGTNKNTLGGLEGSYIKKLQIPSGIYRIENLGMIPTQRIRIPKNVKEIAGGIFNGCYVLFVIDLTDFDDPNEIPALLGALGNRVSNITILEVLNQTMYEAFISATNWSVYADRFQIKPSGGI